MISKVGHNYSAQAPDNVGAKKDKEMAFKAGFQVRLFGLSEDVFTKNLDKMKDAEFDLLNEVISFFKNPFVEGILKKLDENKMISLDVIKIDKGILFKIDTDGLFNKARKIKNKKKEPVPVATEAGSVLKKNKKKSINCRINDFNMFISHTSDQKEVFDKIEKRVLKLDKNQEKTEESNESKRWRNHNFVHRTKKSIKNKDIEGLEKNLASTKIKQMDPNELWWSKG